MDEKKYEVVPMDGHFTEFDSLDVPYLHYSDMSFDDAMTLCRLSFDQGFECVLWRAERDPDSGTPDG